MNTITSSQSIYRQSNITAIYPRQLGHVTAPSLVDLSVVEYLRKILSAEDWQELLDVFLDESSEAIAILEQSYYDSDVQRLNAISNRLKNITSTMGAAKLHQLATLLELKNRTGDWDNMAIILVKLSECHAKTVRLLLKLCAE